MQQRKLGESEIEIAPLVFGGNLFGWTIDKTTSFKLLDAFTEAGFNCIDTADVYAKWAPGNEGGESERIIGEWLKKRSNRDRVVIATKVGSKMGQGLQGLSKNYIREAVEASLRRLQTDYIDLYQSHTDDPDTPVEETLEAYSQLIEEGKVRIIGASNFSPERLQESLQASLTHHLPRYQCFQPKYNLYDREDFEQKYLQLCQKNNLAVITYSSLASGFLTGKYRSEEDFSKSTRGKGMGKYLDERGKRVLQALDEVAEKFGVSPASVAIAWLMAQPGVTAPIASATKQSHLDALIKAAHLNLNQRSLEILNQASAYQLDS